MFLRDVYPGAKRSPVELVRMMATPEIDANIKMAGISFLTHVNMVMIFDYVFISLKFISVDLLNLLFFSISYYKNSQFEM